MASTSALDALCRELGLPQNSLQVQSVLADLYQRLDHQVRAGSRDRNLPCHKGCSACCHESVFVSAPEFLVVVADLAQTTRAVQAQVMEGMEAAAHRYDDELELLQELPPGPERAEVAARIKFRCPILSPAGACRVYRWRELNGRTFGQSWDGKMDRPYGCSLTHQAVGRQRLNLVDAWSPRAELVQMFPEATEVHVYPWWFTRHRAAVLAAWAHGEPGPGAGSAAPRGRAAVGTEVARAGAKGEGPA